MPCCVTLTFYQKPDSTHGDTAGSLSKVFLKAFVECPSGRHFTISLALPGSILDNAQSPELRTYLAGQVWLKDILCI